MADGVPVSPGTGISIAADEVTGLTPTLTGPSQVQYVKIADGTPDSTNKLIVDSSGRITVELPTGGGQTLRFGVISDGASGDATLVAAAGAGLKIKVVSYVIMAAGTVSVKFLNGPGGGNLTGAFPLVANTGIAVAGSTNSHLFETSANTALVINLSAAVSVTGHYSYYIEA